MSTYCNARQYCDQFGLAEVTLLLQDEQRELEPHVMNAVARNDALLLAQLNPRQLIVGNEALARLNAILDQSAALMNGYLRSRVTLPMTPEQIAKTPLMTCNAHLARCALMDDTDNSTELSEKKCATWRDYLRDVNKGTVKLLPDDASNQDASVNTGEVRHGCGKTTTNWNGYGYP